MSDHANVLAGDRRHAERHRNYALYFTIAIQIIATVWGAATLTATVVQLRESVVSTGRVQAALATAVTNIQIDVAVLKDREQRVRHNE